MIAFIKALRWDVVLQARNGFYWASAFVVLVVGGLLLSVPENIRADGAACVPALVAVNLPITTFFFVAGLMLLERDEGTLSALAVSPFSPAAYLATRTITLTVLASVETVALVLVVFGIHGSWLLILAGTAALGVIYTGVGSAVGARYVSVSGMLLPASVFVAILLLPLLPHFGLRPRAPFLVHPIEPALALIRAGYGVGNASEVTFGAVGSVFWSAVAFGWVRNRIARVMRDTRARGGR